MKIRHRKRALARQRHDLLMKNRGLAGIRDRSLLQCPKLRQLARHITAKTKQGDFATAAFEVWSL